MTPAAPRWWVFGSLGASAMIGFSLLWDYSWHTTIGRDTFWTPAHFGLYLGSLLGGGIGAVLILRATWTSVEAGQEAVAVGGLKAPLGAWVLVWGALAMLASAPFDDWWHRAYGLDARVFTPPHTLLLIGMAGLALGAVLLVSAEGNRQPEHPGSLRVARMVASGLLLAMGGFIGGGYLYRTFMHSSNFYLVAALVFPLFLVGARAHGGRWSMTAAALVYMMVSLLMIWLLPLFPAEPRVGPVHFRPVRFVAPHFPVLLVGPALILDLVWSRLRQTPHLQRVLLLGAGFVVALLLVQWPFGDFLMTPTARGWFFAADNFRYNLSPESYTARHLFYPWDSSVGWMVLRLLAAVVLAAGSIHVGLGWCRVLSRVQR